jgi:hypothetical protein
VRDKPSFDDLVAPEPPSRTFRGLTDEQWAAREARRERNLRALCGAIVGLAVGGLGVWRWLLAPNTELAALLVIGGSTLAFALLFARRRDEAAGGLAGWIVLPEWKFVHALPWWAFAVAWIMAALLLVALATLVVIGWIPFRSG